MVFTPQAAYCVRWDPVLDCVLPVADASSERPASLQLAPMIHPHFRWCLLTWLVGPLGFAAEHGPPWFPLTRALPLLNRTASSRTARLKARISPDACA